MKYKILIQQILNGYVEIEAPDEATALDIADTLYNEEGQELPDMEDGIPLSFFLI